MLICSVLAVFKGRNNKKAKGAISPGETADLKKKLDVTCCCPQGAEPDGKKGH